MKPENKRVCFVVRIPPKLKEEIKDCLEKHEEKTYLEIRKLVIVISALNLFNSLFKAEITMTSFLISALKRELKRFKNEM